MKEFQEKLRVIYSIPMMKAKMICINCKSFEEAEKKLAETEENWCWNLLDYRDSEELKNLKKYKEKKRNEN